MKKYIYIILFIIPGFIGVAKGQTNLISTFAGSVSGTSGWTGDGGNATSAQLFGPSTVIVDGSGNVFICDASNNRVRMVNTSGIISEIAGNGSPSYGGDGGPATAAAINHPAGLAIDGSGNLYVSDWGNHVIRRISPIVNGTITTVAGNPEVSGFAGDGGPATAANFFHPYGLSFDSYGNLYIADQYNHCVREIIATTDNILANNTIVTFAGIGTSAGYNGDVRLATTAKLNYPNCVYVDPFNNVFISDNGNHRIRKVNTSDIIYTVAGNGTGGWAGDGLPATNSSVEIDYPSGMKTDELGNLYFSVYDNRIRKVNSAGIISTIANNSGTTGTLGDGGAATAAELNAPNDVAIDHFGNILIADDGNNRIQIIASGVGIPTIVNGERQSLNVCENSSQVDISSLLAVNDTDHGLTETWSLRSGPYNGVAFVTYTVTTTGSALTPVGLYYLPNTNYSGPDSFKVWVNNGYALDSTTIVVNVKSFYAGLITPEPVIICPGNTVQLSSDTSGGTWHSNNSSIASVNSSGLVTGNTAGNVIVSYSITNSCGTAVSRALVTVGNPIISTFAGTGVVGHGADGGAATATALDWPTNTAMDASGNIYYTDYTSGYIRMITTSNQVYTVAGNGTLGWTGDGGPATAAEIYNPSGIAVDGSGNIIFTDYTAYVIRKISPSNTISTIAGIGSTGSSGDGIPATTAAISRSWGCITDASGNVYFSDRYNNNIRKITPSGYIYTFAGNGSASFSGDGGPATAAALNEPLGIAFDLTGNMYICDASNSRIRKVSTTGIITTVCGSGTAGYGGDGLPATNASVKINTPTGICTDSAGNIYIDEWSGNRTRLINTSGIISTIAGTGTIGYNGDGIPATSAELNTVQGVAVYGSGDMYISDELNQRIRKVDPVDPAAVAAISGPSSVCQLSTIGLTDATPGGSWSSSNTSVAIMSSAYGQVYGVSAGTAVISYYFTYQCGTMYSTQVVTVKPYAPITPDPAIVCPGNTTPLSDAMSGGPWSSSNGSIATVNGSGVVTGVSSGNAIITYAITGGCDAYSNVTVGNPTITTFAGNGTGGYLTDGVAATSTEINSPQGIISDAAGNIYFCDFSNNRVREINTSGIISTIAGTGVPGSIGDGSPAVSAELNGPVGMYMDGPGNIYIAEYNGAVIRKINTSGIIFTVAGSGTSGFGGDGGPATAADLRGPGSVCFDASGNMYIADALNNRIRIVNTSNVIGTYAGTGSGGYTVDGVPATASELYDPSDILLDGSGNMIFADQSNNRIRKIYANSNIITTIAGTGVGTFGGDGLAATAAQIHNPTGLFMDKAGNLLITDDGNNKIREINTSGIISSVAGTGTPGFGGDGGPATAAVLNYPIHITEDAAGDIFFSDNTNNRIREIAPQGAALSPISGPTGVCQGSTINLTDATSGGAWSSSNGGVASVGTTGIVTGVSSGSAVISYSLAVSCGTSVVTQTITVSPTPAAITGPTIVCPGNKIVLNDATSGGVWSSSNGSIASVLTGTVTGVSAGNVTISYSLGVCSALAFVVVGVDEINTIAGIGSAGNSGDGGAATSAAISSTEGIAVDASGNVYFADNGNNRVRKVTPAGIITDFAGNGTAGFNFDNIQATASELYSPTGVAVDAAGNVYIADEENNRIRKVNTSGIITTVAGTGSGSYFGDGLPATSANLYLPVGIAVDASGNLFIGDYNNQVVRKVNTAGIISTYAGTGTAGYNFDNVAATAAKLNNPQGVALDGNGNLFIADLTNNRIRMVNSAGIISTVAGTGSPGFSGDGGAATNATISSTVWFVAVDGNDNLYIGDRGNNRVREVSHGIINTFAGNGTTIVGGNGSPATASGMYNPTGVALDASGDVYIGDYNDYLVRKVSPADPNIPAVGGASSICLGTSTTLTDATSGGTWTSGSPAVASIGTGTGITTGLTIGTAIITYTVLFPCGTSYTTHTVVVNSNPASISPLNSNVCPLSSEVLTDATTGGAWSSSASGTATVTNGTVTGVVTGTVIITYSVGTCFTTASVTVLAGPQPISGTLSVCTGNSTTLNDATSSGTWTSSSGSIATVGTGTGYVTGISAGTVTISYSISSGCSSLASFTVNPGPAGITGNTSFCQGTSTTLNDLVSGGTWSSSNGTVASVFVATSGNITGVTAGTASITYSMGAGCITSTQVTVNPNPSSISGVSSICVGGSATLTDVTAGGSWISGTTATGTIGSTSGIIVGLSHGTTIVTYELSTGCSETTVFTVNSAPSGITGIMSICAGSSTTLYDGVSGGTWSSSSTATGTIGSNSGIVTGISSGTTIITYNLGAGCIAMATVTVNAIPGAISPPGSVNICPGASVTLSDGGLGTWSSSILSVATVGSTTGIVAGLLSGTVTISYTNASGCSALKTVTVNVAPGAISPPNALVCVGGVVNITDVISGGSWTSSNLAVATIGSITGIASGVTTGTAFITYTLNGCVVTSSVTVSGILNPGVITGANIMCVSTPTTLTESVGSGVWSSGNLSVASIGATTGSVTGIGAGTVIITYAVSNSCGTAIATHTLTVDILSAGTISGASMLCAGTFTTYTDATGGGTWSVNNVSASIDGTGLLTAITAGTNIITYSVSNVCGTAYTTQSVSIGAYLTAGSITGLSSVCVGSSITLNDLAPGGTWSVSNSDASVAGGTVTGLVSGVDVVSYTVSSSCGSAYAFHTVTVNPLPAAGSITGPASICLGGPATYLDATGGGTWSMANASATILGGVVTPVGTGSNIVSYAVSNVCGTAYATKTINIGAFLTAGTISGFTGVCAGASITLTDATGGGIWSAGNGYATVSGGVVTGVSAGVDTISYTVTASCGSVSAIYPITVYPLPGTGTISGPTALCIGSPATYTDGVTGGTWSLANGTASVTGGGFVTPLSVGTNILSYTVSNSCGMASATQNIAIGTSTPIGPISGPGGVCEGAAVYLSDPISGGTWISSNTSVATIEMVSGLVTGVAQGSTIITYTVTSTCGTAWVADTIGVSIPPVSGAISGPSTVCVGSYINLTDPATGGSWSSSSSDASVTQGTVTGLVAGAATISYTVSNFCGSSSATQNVTVNPALTGTGISGLSTVCAGSAIMLSDGVLGGTWSSSAPMVAIVGSSSGVVIGVTPGSAIISYSINNTCGTTLVTTPVTVNVGANAGAITGPTAVCYGFTITLADTVLGGIWSSSNPSVATIGSGSGAVDGIVPGTTIISYAVSNSCGTAYATQVVAVNTFPSVTAITGSSVLCTSVPTTFTDGAPGGVWSSNNANATVGSSTGIVTGVNPGSDIISYTLTNACSSAGTTFAITINPSPDPGTITGPDSLCVFDMITLADPAIGGSWTAGNTNASVSGGVVTGITAGTDPISYTVSNSCGSASAVLVVTVDLMPNPGVITGPVGMCIGSEITLVDTIPGGSWYESNSNANLTGPGMVTGVAPGIDSIFYSITNGCGTQVASKIITVYPTPPIAPILGTTSQCVGTSTTLYDPTTGGSWTSSDALIASVGSTGTVTGMATGTSTITYTVVSTFGCTGYVTAYDTVGAATAVPAISGTPGLCTGASVTFTDGMSGGSWISGNTAVASVNSSGVVTGLAPGTSAISYSITNTCGVTSVLYVVSVSNYPVVDAIGGAGTMCAGSSETLTDAISGGIWTSSDALVASVGSVSGMVTGVSAGAATIDYAITNSCGTAATTATVHINPLPDPGVITGASGVCIGSSVTLTESVTGGAWSAGNADATVLGGVVTGVSTGVDPISYTVSNSCGTAYAIQSVTISNYPTVDSVLGASTLCVGASITLTDATTGGAWSCSNALATVSGGVVTGVGTGTDTVIYTVANACATVAAIRIVTIHPAANPGVISGASSLCTGATITLTETVTGGTWGRSNTDATVSGGVVTGVTPGIDTISYSVTGACGVVAATHVVTISLTPNAGTITGPTGVCAGTTITVADVATGGVWSATNGDASVMGGVVTGVSAGTDTIVYTVTTACGSAVARKTVLVSTTAGAGTISGYSAVCEGRTITLTDAITGGLWSAANSRASVSGGVVTGVSAGVDTIKYTASNGCGSGTASKVITVNPLPEAGSVTGEQSSVCPGMTITLGDAVVGGAWSSGNMGLATVSGGLVTGVSQGVVYISYSVTNACGTATASYPVTVLGADECNTLVNNVSVNTEELKVYPNPNTGQFELTLISGYDRPLHVIITNVLGETVMEFNAVTNKIADVSLSQPAGVYLLSVVSPGGHYQAKVTVE